MRKQPPQKPKRGGRKKGRTPPILPSEQAPHWEKMWEKVHALQKESRLSGRQIAKRLLDISRTTIGLGHYEYAYLYWVRCGGSEKIGPFIAKELLRMQGARFKKPPQTPG